MELGAGRIVSGWRVEEPLGRGAMAVVYRVRHTELGTLAALKVLDRVDPTTEHRLLQEGRAQGSIHHPGIVSVLDFVRVDGHAALLLEYVPGSDLAALLARRWVSLDEALDLFRQVVSAVAAAHAAGLVHRDLKPSNILVTETARGLVAKVGDFGLVKSESADLTATHALVGTPKYMAPEQMRAARKVDARADLFALGCVLYELVCGRPAFPGDDLVELYAAKSAGHYASPDRLVADLPRPVVLAIGACLEGAVARRIPSCGTLLAVLGGAPWSASAGADETLDVDLGGSVCPACGAAVPAERCPACGADPNLGQRYRLVDQLSVGVWRSLDLREGRWVVVRMLRGTDRERFDRGARVARELQHPQIARGLEPPFDEHGRRWEIRELVEGMSLADVLATHRFSEAEVLEVVQELAAPLRYLADRSPPVVHRALAPSHVIRATDGRLVLIDFAQVRDVRGDGSLHDRPDGAPELWVGEASPASDVYGLGALAVTLLTRRPAHELRVADRIVFEDHVTVSDGTKALLRAMVSSVPEERPSIGEVARRAGQIAAELRRPASPVVVRPSGSGRQAVVALLAVSALLTLLIMAGVVYIVGQEPAATQIPRPDGPSPSRILEPGADLADRPVPGADCGTPFDLSIRLVGERDQAGTGVPLFARTPCDRMLVPLGTVPVGEAATVHLPGPASIVVPWSEARCGSMPCDERVLKGQDPSGAPLELRLNDAESFRVVDPHGDPIAGARISPGWIDAWGRVGERPDLTRPLGLSQTYRYADPPTVVTGTDGLATFPWGFYGLYELTVDGVHRTSGWDPNNGFVVKDRRSTAAVLVVDPAGKPIPGAEVVCIPDGPKSPARGWVGRTDEKGHLACDVDPDAATSAVVSAPGFVTSVVTLLPPELRVTLTEARTVRVGCAGTWGSWCTNMVTEPVCAGARDQRSPGICRFDGASLACDCNPTADRLVHGVLGTVEIPVATDRVWYDLRNISGGVEGLVPSASEGCTVSLETSRGRIGGPVEPSGRFSLVGVPAGGYAMTVRCKRGPGYAAVDVTVGDGVTNVEVGKPDKLLGVPTLLRPPKPGPAPAPESPPVPDVERELVDYTFPPYPDGFVPNGLVICSMRVTIGADGVPTAARISECPDALHGPATEAVLEWRWKPGPAETTEELNVPFAR